MRIDVVGIVLGLAVVLGGVVTLLDSLSALPPKVARAILPGGLVAIGALGLLLSHTNRK